MGGMKRLSIGLAVQLRILASPQPPSGELCRDTTVTVGERGGSAACDQVKHILVINSIANDYDIA